MANPDSSTSPQNSSTEASLFVAPNGMWWSAGHGAHTPTMRTILEAVGFDGMIGTVILVDSGEWVQELRDGQLVPMTASQREIVEWASNFPDSGVKDAAAKLLRHFDTVANEKARAEKSERQLAAIRYIVNMENEGPRQAGIVSTHNAPVVK